MPSHNKTSVRVINCLGSNLCKCWLQALTQHYNNTHRRVHNIQEMQGSCLVIFWGLIYCQIHISKSLWFFHNHFDIFHNFRNFRFNTSIFRVFIFTILAIMLLIFTITSVPVPFTQGWETALKDYQKHKFCLTGVFKWCCPWLVEFY